MGNPLGTASKSAAFALIDLAAGTILAAKLLFGFEPGFTLGLIAYPFAELAFAFSMAYIAMAANIIKEARKAHSPGRRSAGHAMRPAPRASKAKIPFSAENVNKIAKLMDRVMPLLVNFCVLSGLAFGMLLLIGTAFLSLSFLLFGGIGQPESGAILLANMPVLILLLGSIGKLRRVISAGDPVSSIKSEFEQSMALAAVLLVIIFSFILLKALAPSLLVHAGPVPLFGITSVAVCIWYFTSAVLLLAGLRQGKVK